jgi:predicted DNA-binding ribbon-helix-helix protein
MYVHVDKRILTYMSTKKVATTVKVENTLYDQFKILGIRHKLTLQGLVEKAVYRYVSEDVFRAEINSFVLPVSATSSSLA